MKKSFIMFGILLCLTGCGSMYTSKNENKKSAKEYVYLDKEWSIPGVYPVTPNDETWKQLDTAEAIEVCQMPEELLKNISTEDLCDYVLNYPFLSDYKMFNSITEGVNNLTNKSNIIAECMNRKDAIGVMLDKYDKLTVDYNALINEQNVDYSILQKNTADEFLKVYFAFKLGDLSDKEKEKLVKILEDKHLKKREIVGSTDYASGFYQVLQELGKEIDENLVITE